MLCIITSMFLIPYMLDYRKQKAARECFIAEFEEKGKEIHGREKGIQDA